MPWQRYSVVEQAEVLPVGEGVTAENCISMLGLTGMARVLCAGHRWLPGTDSSKHVRKPPGEAEMASPAGAALSFHPPPPPPFARHPALDSCAAN